MNHSIKIDDFFLLIPRVFVKSVNCKPGLVIHDRKLHYPLSKSLQKEGPSWRLTTAHHIRKKDKAKLMKRGCNQETSRIKTNDGLLLDVSSDLS